MALGTAITRSRTVQSVQAGPVSGTVQVTWTVQPTTSTPAYQQQEILSTAEWNEIAGQQGSGGQAGLGVTVTTTSQ